jgi:hypothetical protein
LASHEQCRGDEYDWNNVSHNTDDLTLNAAFLTLLGAYGIKPANFSQVFFNQKMGLDLPRIGGQC